MSDTFEGIADATSGRDTSTKTFSEALRGLTPCQQAYVASVMKKAFTLQMAGIKEQRRSVGWKWVECICVALTPICISVVGNFGEDYRQPLQLLAIGLSLVSTLSRLSPQGRGEALLSYATLLRRVCWSYWSATGVFANQAELEASKKAKAFWQAMQTNERAKRGKVQQALQSGDQASTASPAGSLAPRSDVGDLDCLPAELSQMEADRASLFQQFVQQVMEAMDEGEDELQRSYGSPGTVHRAVASEISRSSSVVLETPELEATIL